MRALRKFRLPLLLIPAFFLASLAAWGETPEPLLPAQLGPWKKSKLGWEMVAAPQLERVAGNQAALLREYGAQRAERAAYFKYDGGDTGWGVTVYEMKDRSGAYGAFSLIRGEFGRPVKLGEAGYWGRNAHTFYQSNYLVRVFATDDDTEELARLADYLRVQAGPQASLPTLPGYLPREGFIAGSDRYLLGPIALAEVAPLAPGDWAGFAYGAEAEAGRYRLGRSEATLLLLSYPTPQIAGARLRDFERLFNLNGVGDPNRPLVYAKRKGTLIVLASGVTSEMEAANLLNRVRYEAEISWSETSDPRPQPDWALTISNLFIGTGLFLVYALLSGLAFGTLRLLMKRLLPGKVFDRPEDTEIIQLNLAAKR